MAIEGAVLTLAHSEGAGSAALVTTQFPKKGKGREKKKHESFRFILFRLYKEFKEIYLFKKCTLYVFVMSYFGSFFREHVS